MKKLFNYALLAAALLIGVNVNAENVCELTLKGETTQHESLYDALDAVTTAALLESRGIAPEAYINHETDFYEAAALADSTVAHIKLLKDETLEPGRFAKVDGYKYVMNAGERITIDLNGNTLISNVRFNLVQASLYFINSNDEKVATINSNVEQFINTYGSRDKDAAYGFCHGIIGKNVVLNAKFDTYAFGIFPNDYYFKKFNGTPYAYQHGPGAGALVDIYGEVRCTYGVSTNGQLNEKDGNIPVITIHEGAKLVATNKNDAVAIYAGGYAKWIVNGYAEGATAIYIKAGEFDLDGATVVATGDYANPQPNGNGCDATGAAVVIDTHDSYAGGIVVNVEGNTNISSANGYGIQEVITKGDESVSHCEGINIESGNISGADGKAAISTTEVGTGVVNIEGGTFNSDVAIYIAGKTDGIINPSTDENGNTIYVVSTKPEGKDWKDDITHAQAGDYIKLGQDADQTIGNGSAPASIEAEYLVAEKNAKVTIPEGKILTVGEIVMSKDAQIVVEKNAKLIVKGDKGIVANQATNIVLKSEEGAPAYFLLDPLVSSNKTPKATVKFTSNSWYQDAQHYQYQYFGAPFVGGALESVKPLGGFAKRTVFYVWNKTSWVEGGYIEGDTDNLKYEAFQNPFGFYAMVANTPQGMPVTYEFDGRLYGNTNPEVHVIKGYVPLSNGFSANMDGDLLIEQLGSTTINKAAWAPISNADGTLQWKAYTELRALGEVAPMGTFMVQNGGSGTDLVLDYESLVWDNKSGAKAPKVNNFAMATVRVDGCGLNDIITIAEDNMFSADYDNGYDAEKYENTSIRFYVNADKEYDIFATDNMNNTKVGFMTTKAGKYTISFEGVTGEFALVDLATNARIDMVEGATYEFLAEEGENAERFMVVAAAKAPTNTPATKAAVKATKALINDQIVISNGERFFNMLGTDVK